MAKTRTRGDLFPLARQCYHDAGTYAEGARLLLARLPKDDQDLVIGDCVHSAAVDFMRAAMAELRRSVWEAQSRSVREAQISAVSTLASSNAESLLDFPLPGGMPLRRATRDDLEQAVRWYATLSADFRHKSRWLARVLDSLPAGKRVDEVFSADALDQLQVKTAAR